MEAVQTYSVIAPSKARTSTRITAASELVKEPQKPANGTTTNSCPNPWSFDRERLQAHNECVNDQARKVLSDAMALSESERENLAELLLTSLPRLSRREQAELEKAWADEAVSRAEALARGELTAEDGASAMEELRAELGTIRSK
jgi:hypothetical protein